MLGDGNGWGSLSTGQLKLTLQSANRQTAQPKLLLEILGHDQLFILGGCNVERFDHHTGCTVTVEALQHLLPDGSVLGIGQNLLLPTAIEQSAWLPPESLYQVPIVDAAGSAPNMARGAAESGQLDDGLSP
jgi:hypothetical protein